MDFRQVSRPVLFALQISGVFSISVKKDGYSFSWFSIETGYAMLIHIAMIAVAFPATLAKIKLLYFGYDMGLSSIFTLVLTAPNFILPIVALISTKSVADYLNEWKIIEDYFLSLTGTPLKFSGLKRVSRVLPCVTIFIPFPVTVIAIILKRHSVVQAIANGWPLLAFDTIATMWQIQARLLASTFAQLSRNYAETLWSTRRVNARDIGRYKLLYSRIASLVGSFERSMNLVTSLTCLSLYIDTTIGAYAAIVGFSEKEVSVYLLWTTFFPLIYCMAVLQVVCEAGGTITVAGGVQFAEDLCALTPKLNSRSRWEFNSMMDMVHLQAPELKLAGCVRLTKGLTFTGLGIMLSYLVALFQFRNSLE